MTDRIAAHLEASGFVRQAETHGGFGTVLRKGDADRGSIALIISNRGNHFACLEKTLSQNGRYCWQITGPGEGSAASAIEEWVKKRVKIDEDIWLIELDIANAGQFIAEIIAQA